MHVCVCVEMVVVGVCARARACLLKKDLIYMLTVAIATWLSNFHSETLLQTAPDPPRPGRQGAPVGLRRWPRDQLIRRRFPHWDVKKSRRGLF